MKPLILYYSYHGNTQRIAERIHAAIGGDIARIDTVAPYTGDYDDVVAQGEREVKRGYLPPLKPMDIDLDRYDTIVLGTPVWWYTCSPAMRAFLTAHDLSGKTVYPFATNGGWLGRSRLRGIFAGFESPSRTKRCYLLVFSSKMCYLFGKRPLSVTVRAAPPTERKGRDGVENA